MARNNRQPRIEGLENRELLTTALTHGWIHPACVQVTQAHLHGKISGTFTLTSSGIPDTGSTTTFSGSGTISPLGNTTTSGQLNAPGFTINHQPNGTVTLQGARGSLVLAIHGTSMPDGAGTPTRFQYTIQHGTSHYQGYTGHGTVILTTLADPTGTGSVQAVNTGGTGSATGITDLTNLPISIGPGTGQGINITGKFEARFDGTLTSKK